MTFKKWDKWVKRYSSDKEGHEMYADWKAERTKLIGALEYYLKYDHRDGPCTCAACVGARAVLAEVKEGKDD